MTHGWPLVPLGEILDKSNEWVVLDPQTEYKEVTVRLWGRGVILRGVISGSQVAGSRRLRVHPREFIASRIDARNGAFGLIPAELDGAMVTNDFPVFVATKDRLLPEYLGWLSKTRGFVESCKTASEGTTNRVRLKEDKFTRMKIPLPPLPEQRRIVARIERLAAKIEEARELRTQTNLHRELIHVSARHRVFSRLTQQIKTVRIDEIADSRLGKMLSRNQSLDEKATPYLRNANIQWDRLDLRDVHRMEISADEKATFSLLPGDILVCEGGDIGKSAIWNAEIPGCVYQKALHRVRVDQSIVLPRFMLHHIFWGAEQGHFADIKTQTTIAHLTGVKLKAYHVVIPSLAEQHHIVAYLDGLQAKANPLKALQSRTAADLDALLPAILDRAFRGEL